MPDGEVIGDVSTNEFGACVEHAVAAEQVGPDAVAGVSDIGHRRSKADADGDGSATLIEGARRLIADIKVVGADRRRAGIVKSAGTLVRDQNRAGAQGSIAADVVVAKAASAVADGKERAVHMAAERLRMHAMTKCAVTERLAGRGEVEVAAGLDEPVGAEAGVGDVKVVDVRRDVEGNVSARRVAVEDKGVAGGGAGQAAAGR